MLVIFTRLRSADGIYSNTQGRGGPANNSQRGRTSASVYLRLVSLGGEHTGNRPNQLKETIEVSWVECSGGGTAHLQ